MIDGIELSVNNYYNLQNFNDASTFITTEDTSHLNQTLAVDIVIIIY